MGTKSQLRNDMNTAIVDLERLADEIRVKIHLANMDAKQLWSTKLEPALENARQHAREATVTSKSIVDDTVKALQAFAHSLAASTSSEQKQPPRGVNGAKRDVATAASRPASKRATTVREIMTSDVATCGPDEMLGRCAQLMWDRACGCVPVVDHDGQPVAMVTDRDVCMGAYTQGLPISQILVSSTMSKQIYVVGSDDTIATAEGIMRRYGIRRLPVVDTNGRIVGILSFSDIVAHGELGPLKTRDGLSAHAIAETVSCISHVALHANGT